MKNYFHIDSKTTFYNEKEKRKIGIPRNVLALKVANFVARDILSVQFSFYNTACCRPMALSKEWGRTKVKVRMECNFELFVASKEILEITMNIEIILFLNLAIGYNF